MTIKTGSSVDYPLGYSRVNTGLPIFIMEAVNQLKYIAYARKSTESSERQVLSIESQLDRIKDTFGDIEIIDLVTESKSAFKPYNRTAFQSVLDRVKSGEAQGIVAWHPDRLSRNEIDASSIIYLIRQGLLKDIKFCSYTFENTPEGIWMLQINLSQSQYFSAKLSKDVKRGIKKKLELGWFPGIPPLGYLNDQVDKTIVPDPARFSLIRRMWDLMLTGSYTPPKILEIANNEWGFRTRQFSRSGGNKLAKSAIYKIFSNVFYTGVIEHKGKYYKGAHKPMITEEEFDRVQKLLGRKGRPRPKEHDFAYTGVFRCLDCGAYYTAESKNKYIKKTGKTKKYIYYHPTKKGTGCPCSKASWVRESKLEPQIISDIANFSIISEFRDWAIDIIERNKPLEETKENVLVKTKKTTSTDIQTQLKELRKMRIKNLITDTEYLEDKKALEADLSKLNDSNKEHNKEEKLENLSRETFNFAVHCLSEFTGTEDLNRKREILLSLGSNHTLIDGKLRYESSCWLEPIKRSYPELKEEYDRIELMGNVDLRDKTKALEAIITSWQGWQESNPRKWFWRPLYYHYTTPLSYPIILFMHFFINVSHKLVKSQCL